VSVVVSKGSDKASLPVLSGQVSGAKGSQFQSALLPELQVICQSRDSRELELKKSILLFEIFVTVKRQTKSIQVKKNKCTYKFYLIFITVS